jgi:hypothetical protein
MSDPRPVRWRRPVAGTAAAVALALGFLARPLPAADPPPDPPADDAANKDGSAAKAKQPAKPLSFGDDDLEKYHKPKPGTEPAAAPAPPATAGAPAGKAPAAAPAGAVTAGKTTAPAGPAKPSAAAVMPGRKPPAPAPATTTYAPGGPAMAKPPSEDPLKKWKDQDAKTVFRQEQLRGLRERIEAIQSRLDYLNQKRLAILDPLRVMPKGQSEADRAADAAKGPRDLLAAVDDEIRALEEEQKQAKDDLVAVETRFAQESGQP